MAQDAIEEQLLLVAYWVHTATTNLPDALVKVHRYRLCMCAAAILPSLVSLFIQERQTRLVPTVLLPVKPWTLRVGAGASGRAAGVLFKFSPGPRWINPCFASELVLIAVCAVEGLVAVAASPAVIPALAIGAAAMLLRAFSGGSCTHTHTHTQHARSTLLFVAGGIISRHCVQEPRGR